MSRTNAFHWQWLRIGAAAAIFLMMAISVADVLGRKFADKPLRGSVELIEVTMLLTVFLAWPLVAQSRAHITLDLVDTMMPANVQALRERLGELVGAILMIGAAYLAYSRGMQALHEKEVTALIEIPLAPLQFLVSALFLFTGAVHAVLSIRGAPTVRTGHETPGEELL